MSSLRFLLLAFAVGFGAVVAYRLNAEAMAVIVGALLGILGSLPVALLILYTLRQRDRKAAPAESAPYSGYSGWTPSQATQPQPQPPQIIVVGGLPQSQPTPWGYGLSAPQPPAAPAPPAANSRFNLIPYDQDDV